MSIPRRWGYPFAAGLVVIATGTAWWMQRTFQLPDPSLVFLTGMLAAAVWGGLGPSLAASIASLFVYDFFFIEPRYSLSVTKPHHRRGDDQRLKDVSRQFLDVARSEGRSAQADGEGALPSWRRS